MHPNEERLRDIYTKFNQGDIGAFFAACTDSATYTVPGSSFPSGVYNSTTFLEMLGRLFERTNRTFRESVLEVVANDEHAVLLLHHAFDRDGQHHEYRTAHICELIAGKIAKWTEHPGSISEFDAAWGT